MRERTGIPRAAATSDRYKQNATHLHFGPIWALCPGGGGQRRPAGVRAENREAAGRARTTPRRIRGANTLTRPRHIFRKIHPTFWLRCSPMETDLLFFYLSRLIWLLCTIVAKVLLMNKIELMTIYNKPVMKATAISSITIRYS
jgi:hypothetical protein